MTEAEKVKKDIPILKDIARDLFASDLIKLSQMVEAGKLSSSGARTVYAALYGTHKSRLNMIEGLYERGY